MPVFGLVEKVIAKGEMSMFAGVAQRLAAS